MTKIPQTPEDLDRIIGDLDYITRNVRDVRGAMAIDRLETVPMDVSTALTHLTWLKNWSDGIPRALKLARVAAEGAARHKEMAERRKKERGRK